MILDVQRLAGNESDEIDNESLASSRYNPVPSPREVPFNNYNPNARYRNVPNPIYPRTGLMNYANMINNNGISHANLTYSLTRPLLGDHLVLPASNNNGISNHSYELSNVPTVRTPMQFFCDQTALTAEDRI